MNPIIFLDIDGVLNSTFFMLNRESKSIKIDFKAIQLLNTFISKVDAKVVISSSWRKTRTVDQLQQVLTEYGFTGEVIGKTPTLSGDCVFRGNEIFKWLKDNGYPSDFRHYVIIDDDSDILYWQKDNYINVDGYYGLTPNTVYKAERLLNLYKK